MNGGLVKKISALTRMLKRASIGKNLPKLIRKLTGEGGLKFVYSPEVDWAVDPLFRSRITSEFLKKQPSVQDVAWYASWLRRYKPLTDITAYDPLLPQYTDRLEKLHRGFELNKRDEISPGNIIRQLASVASWVKPGYGVTILSIPETAKRFYPYLLEPLHKYPKERVPSIVERLYHLNKFFPMEGRLSHILKSPDIQGFLDLVRKHPYVSALYRGKPDSWLRSDIKHFYDSLFSPDSHALSFQPVDRPWTSVFIIQPFGSLLSAAHEVGHAISRSLPETLLWYSPSTAQGATNLAGRLRAAYSASGPYQAALLEELVKPFTAQNPLQQVKNIHVRKLVSEILANKAAVLALRHMKHRYPSRFPYAELENYEPISEHLMGTYVRNMPLDAVFPSGYSPEGRFSDFFFESVPPRLGHQVLDELAAASNRWWSRLGKKPEDVWYEMYLPILHSAEVLPDPVELKPILDAARRGSKSSWSRIFPENYQLDQWKIIGNALANFEWFLRDPSKTRP